MTRTRITICGIRDPDTARAAADAGADAIGLNFAPGSPRLITIEQAESILRVIPAFVEPVALFVDAGAETINGVCSRLGIRTVQLHSRETPAEAAALAPLRVIRALSFGPDAATAAAAWHAQVPNLAGLLWDAPPSASPGPAQLPGGTGRTLDWAALAAAARQSPPWPNGVPLILAGGLNPGNVAQAIATVRPYAVDVSSGVESTRGVKDIGLIQAFCRAVQQPCAAG